MARVIQQARRLRKIATRHEKRLWWQLRDRKLGGLKFRRQVPIGDRFVDFFCAEAHLAIELDGSGHCRHFTEMATDEEIVALHAIFDEVKRAAKMGAAQEAVALMLRFNDHLVTVSQHDITRDLLNLLNARIHLLRVTSISKPGRLAASLVEISAVLDAVRRRDPELAARNMTIYVCNARDAALEQLSSP